VLEPPHALTHRHTEALELLLAPPEAEPEDQPSAGDQVHRGGVLGNPDRIVQGDQQQPGPDLDPARPRRDRRTHRQKRRQIPVVDEVVLGDPDRIEPELLRVHRQVEGVGVQLLVAAGIPWEPLTRDQPEAEAHARTLPAVASVAAPGASH